MTNHEEQHTPEPWSVGGESDLGMTPIYRPTDLDPKSHHLIADATTLPNARRIVACVNACAGLSDAVLTEWGINTAIQNMTKQNDALRALADELAEALDAAAPELCSNCCPSVKKIGEDWTHTDACQKVTAALAKYREMKGGK